MSDNIKYLLNNQFIFDPKMCSLLFFSFCFSICSSGLSDPKRNQTGIAVDKQGIA